MSTTDFTPSDLSVRIAYSYVDGVSGNLTQQREAAFDRWLSSVKAGVWAEGYKAGNLDGYFGTRDEKNPYEEAQ